MQTPTTTTKATQSTQTVRKFLHRQILRTQPGQSLPSMRTIMDRCSVGQAKVQQVLGEFESAGYVECRPRSGIYRSERIVISETVPTLDFVACARLGEIDHPGTFTHELLAALNLEATDRGHAMRVHQVQRGEAIAAYEEIASRSDTRACLLFAPHSPEVLAAFEKHHLACVSLFPPTEDAAAGHCIHEPHDLVPQLLKHLEARGHARIAFLERTYPNAPVRLSLQRRADYYRHMAERGLKVERQWVADAGADDRAALAGLEQIFAADTTPTALLLPSAAMPAAYRFLERTGRRVGRDVALAGIDDVAACRTLHPEPTRAGIVHQATARLALDALTGLLEGRTVAVDQPAPTRLFIGESTQSPPGA